MKLLIALGAACALSACATTGAEDATLTAIKSARLAPCPAPATNARTTGETPARGITEAELARVALGNDSVGRALRLRRLTIAPDGVIAWHEHGARQGMAYVITGELTEYRNDCADAVKRRAGDVVQEGLGVAHYWRNESGADAIIFVFDAPPPA